MLPSRNSSEDVQPDLSDKSSACSSMKHWFPPESFITPASLDTKASAIQGRNPCLHNTSALDPEWTQLPFGKLKNRDFELKEFSWLHGQFDHNSRTRDDTFFLVYPTTKSQSRTDITFPSSNRMNSDEARSSTLENFPTDIEALDDFDSASNLISGKNMQGEQLSSIKDRDELIFPTLSSRNEDENAVFSTRSTKPYLLRKRFSQLTTGIEFEASHQLHFNNDSKYCKRQKNAFEDEAMSSLPRNDDLILTTETVNLNIQNNVEAFSGLQLNNVFESNRNLKRSSTFDNQITKKKDIDNLMNPFLTPPSKKGVFSSCQQELRAASKDYCKQEITFMQQQKGESKCTSPCETKKEAEDSKQDKKQASKPQSQKKNSKSKHAFCA